MLNAIHDGRGAKIFKFIALAFIAMGVFGLVLMDVGGFFRGGVTNANVARVGSTTISVTDFEREASNILRAQGMSMQEAYRFGTLNTLLNEKIDAELLRQEALNQHLLLDRDTIARIVHDVIYAQIQPGETPQDALNRILRAQGISEGQLIASINQSETASLLQNPLIGAATYVPQLATQALARFHAERRDITFFALTAEQVGRDIQADDATLATYYDTIKDQYQMPEQRSFKVITIDMNALKSGIRITEDDIATAYAQNRDQYRIGEQRRIEQVVTRDADKANALAESARSAQSLQAASENTGYRAPVDVTREGLPAELAEAVFTADKNTVLNPIQTPLGYHVIRILDIKPARTQELSAVRADLRRELESDALHQEMESRITRVDESISAGESIEDIASALDVPVRTIGPIDARGEHAGAPADTTLSALAGNRDLLANLFELMEGETGDLTEVSDGIFAVFSLESVRPSRDRDLAEIRPEIEKRWLAEQRTAALNATVDTLMRQLQTGERDFADAAKDMNATLRTVRDVSRESKVIGLNDPVALSRLFDATDLSSVVRVNTEDGVILAKVLDARIPAAGTVEPQPEVAEQWRIQTQMAVVNLFYTDLRKKHRININDKVMERAFGSQQAEY